MNRNISTIAIFTLAFASLILLTSCNLALAHSGIFVTDVDGQVTVGDARPPLSEFNTTTRVFGKVMYANYAPYGIPLGDYGSNHPGFFALGSDGAGMPAGASALPGGADVSLNINEFAIGADSDAMFYWDGSGAVDFQPITTTQPEVVLGMDPHSPLDPTYENGAMHRHPDSTLDVDGVGVPDNGVYMISPTISVDGLEDSDPFYVLWLVDDLVQNADDLNAVVAALEAGQTTVLGKDFGFFPEAMEYVRLNMVVPEPTSALLGLMALAGMSGGMSVRRRQG